MSEGTIGVVIPIGSATPPWQISECLQSLVDAQSPSWRIKGDVRPTDPAYQVVVFLSLGNHTFVNYGKIAAYDPKYLEIHVVIGARSSFASNVNRGVLEVLGACDPIVILNADTHVFAGQLEAWATDLSLYPNLAITGCVSNYIGGPQLLPTADDGELDAAGGRAVENRSWAKRVDSKPSLRNLAAVEAEDRLRRYNGRLEDASDIKMVAAAIPAWAFERVGLLDERFRPGNREDVDWCWRARQAGYRTAFNHGVFIHHYGSSSFASGDAWRKAMNDNRGRFAAKWSHTLRFQLEEKWADVTIDERRVLEALATEECYSVDPLYWHALCVAGSRPRCALRDLEAYLGVHQRDPRAHALLVECLERCGRHDEALAVLSDMRAWFPTTHDKIDALHQQLFPRKEQVT